MRAIEVKANRLDNPEIMNSYLKQWRDLHNEQK